MHAYIKCKIADDVLEFIDHVHDDLLVSFDRLFIAHRQHRQKSQPTCFFAVDLFVLKRLSTIMFPALGLLVPPQTALLASIVLANTAV